MFLRALLFVWLGLTALAEPVVVPLWPEGVPAQIAGHPGEALENGRVVRVHEPTLTVYRPTDVTATGAAVVYCPGGGYAKLAIGEAGGPETRWLNRLGVTVFVLKYRLDAYRAPAAFRDAVRAVRLVRARAAEFGVDPHRVGMLGMSAGGHLAGCVATRWDAEVGRTGDPLDAVSARPDFVGLVYPVVSMNEAITHRGSRQVLLGTAPTAAEVDTWSVEKQVRSDMPPVFLVATMADKSVPVQNSLRLYEALVAARVPAELHVYAQGSHGDSRDRRYGPTAEWPTRGEEWLRFNGWLTPTSQAAVRP